MKDDKQLDQQADQILIALRARKSRGQLDGPIEAVVDAVEKSVQMSGGTENASGILQRIKNKMNASHDMYTFECRLDTSGNDNNYPGDEEFLGTCSVRAKNKTLAQCAVANHIRKTWQFGALRMTFMGTNCKNPCTVIEEPYGVKEHKRGSLVTSLPDHVPAIEDRYKIGRF